MKQRHALLLTAFLLVPWALLSLRSTDVSAAVPQKPPAIPPLAATVPGGGRPIDALITVGNRARAVSPNKRGGYRGFVIPPKGRVPIELRMPDARENDKIRVVVMDGGRILMGDGKSGEVATSRDQIAGADKRVRFTFEADQGPGLFRVLARQGREERVFEFWVGPRLPVNTRGQEAAK